MYRFNLVVDVVRDISEVIKSKFDTSSCTWSGVEPELKKLWWREWSVSIIFIYILICIIYLVINIYLAY